MPEITQDDHVKMVELRHRLEGATTVQSAMMQQYSSLCSMGSYEQADKLRDQIHAYLDIFMDSVIENSRLFRRLSGLA